MQIVVCVARIRQRPLILVAPSIGPDDTELDRLIGGNIAVYSPELPIEEALFLLADVDNRCRFEVQIAHMRKLGHLVRPRPHHNALLGLGPLVLLTNAIKTTQTGTDVGIGKAALLPALAWSTQCRIP